MLNPKTGQVFGWPAGGYPSPQGPFYCGVGSESVYGRNLAEAHMDACIKVHAPSVFLCSCRRSREIKKYAAGAHKATQRVESCWAPLRVYTAHAKEAWKQGLERNDHSRYCLSGVCLPTCKKEGLLPMSMMRCPPCDICVARARSLETGAERAARAHAQAGLTISGINSEVMPGQWEFQIGPVGPLEVGDQVMVARWLLHRLGENFGIVSTFAPKPVKGDWNGVRLCMLPAQALCCCPPVHVASSGALLGARLCATVIPWGLPCHARCKLYFPCWV